MESELAQYACDQCRTRKVSCSRNRPQCQRCTIEDHTCTYSRAGVIRRNRKKKQTSSAPSASNLSNPQRQNDVQHPRFPSVNATAEDHSTHDRLRRLAGRDHASLKVLAPLFDEYFTAWQDSSAFNRLSENAVPTYFKFGEGTMRKWVDALLAVLKGRKLPVIPTAQEVLERVSSPNGERAWLVMLYSVALSTESAHEAYTGCHKSKLKSNLWLAFNDVRLFLEPSTLNIQALIVLSTYLNEYITPSVCWMLISKACTMTQALNQIRPGPNRSDQRSSHNMLFWQLKVLDKSLALSLMKPPTIHGDMAATMIIPTLDQLVSQQAEPGESKVFDAHYTHQTYQLSEVMGDVSHWLSTQARQNYDHDVVSSLHERLESWYRKATEVLEAAALTERPLLPPEGQLFISQGLLSLQFQYYHVRLLLSRGCKNTRPEGRQLAESLLGCLDSIQLDCHSRCGIHIWQLLFCPFAAFQSLLGYVLMTSKTRECFGQNERSLHAMSRLPPFLGQLAGSSRNPVVKRLEDLAWRFYGHTKAILCSEDMIRIRENHGQQETRDTQKEHIDGQNEARSDTTSTTTGDLLDLNMDTEMDDLFAWWTNDALMDNTFDWFGTIPTG